MIQPILPSQFAGSQVLLKCAWLEVEREEQGFVVEFRKIFSPIVHWHSWEKVFFGDWHRHGRTDDGLIIGPWNMLERGLKHVLFFLEFKSELLVDLVIVTIKLSTLGSSG